METTDLGFRLTSTDGHIIVSKSYQKEEWLYLRWAVTAICGCEMPVEPINGFLTLNAKVRSSGMKAAWISESDTDSQESLYPYPKYKNVIPTVFENKKEDMPMFSFEIMRRAGIIFKHFGIREKCFYPTGWNDPTNLAVWEKDGLLIGLMPIRAASDGF